MKRRNLNRSIKKVQGHLRPNILSVFRTLAYRSLITVHRSLFTVCCLLFTAYCLPLTVAAGTEFGAADDLTVLGTDGTVDDPDVEIKGFTIFGSTNVLTHISTAAGNTVFNGAVEVSSDIYIVGKSTFIDNAYFEVAESIFINDGSANQMLQKNALGSFNWIDISSLGDDLGDHTATEDLDMADFDIVGVSTITVSSITTTVAGITFSTNVYFMNGKIGIGTSSPQAALHVSSAAGVSSDLLIISTGASNVIRMTGAGEIYANKFYGDISGASGLPSGDDLGNHVATTTLDMADFDIVSVSTVTVSTIAISGAGPGIAITSHVYVSGDVHATNFFGDGSGLLGVTGSDDLGNHVATMTLTANYGIITTSITASTGNYSGYVNANGYLVNNSTMVKILPGTNSIAYGVYAGTSNIVGGSYNTFIGNYAGQSNTTGVSNTANGYYALYSNTTGGENTANGNSALRSNTTGNWNTANGIYALRSNTTGSENTANGYGALYFNQTGSANAVLGNEAGGFDSGAVNSFSSSTLMGYRAGYGLTTGSGNLLLGFQSGDNLTTGSRNIIIGYDKNAPTAVTDDHLNIGGVIYGDLSAGNVGIGITAPTAKLHVQAYEAGKYTLQVSTSSTAGNYSIAVSSEGITNINNFAIENRVSDPASPVTGQVWLRVD